MMGETCGQWISYKIFHCGERYETRRRYALLLCCGRPRTMQKSYQISLAIKEEVEDLEKVGIGIIQIDEAASREGLPLRKSEQGFYLRWLLQNHQNYNQWFLGKWYIAPVARCCAHLLSQQSGIGNEG